MGADFFGSGNIQMFSAGSQPFSVSGAASDLFSGAGAAVGGMFAAAGSRASATEYKYAAQYSKTQTGISETMADQKIYQSMSGTKAEVGAAGFQLGGSAQDILRSSAAQGALTKGVISAQGAEQQQAYLQQQKQAKAAASGQLWGGILKAVGEVAGVVAAPFTGGASLALTASLAASK